MGHCSRLRAGLTDWLGHLFFSPIDAYYSLQARLEYTSRLPQSFIPCRIAIAFCRFVYIILYGFMSILGIEI